MMLDISLQSEDHCRGGGGRVSAMMGTPATPPLGTFGFDAQYSFYPFLRNFLGVFLGRSSLHLVEGWGWLVFIGGWCNRGYEREKMTKGKAIKKYCLECGGSERANVMLCHVLDCPLWPFRFGSTKGSKTYTDRMTVAWEHYREARQELERDGITLVDMIGQPVSWRSGRIRTYFWRISRKVCPRSSWLAR